MGSAPGDEMRVRAVDRPDLTAAVPRLRAGLWAGAGEAPDPVPERVLGFWVAEDTSTGEPLGYAVLTRPEPVTERADGYRAGEVAGIVEESDRGQRAASRLLTCLTDAAERLGCARLVSGTRTPRPEATRLGQGPGWQLIPRYGEYRELAAARCVEKTLWTDPPPVPAGLPVRHRPSARALVFDPADRLLLTRNVVTGEDGVRREYWALPGGGIDDGEDARRAAARELAEETGLVGITLAGPVVRHQYWVAFPDTMLHQLEELWWGRADTDRVSRTGLNADEDYLVGLRWWTLDELRGTAQVTFPRLLPDLAESLLRHGTPPTPYVIVADSTHPPGRALTDDGDDDGVA